MTIAVEMASETFEEVTHDLNLPVKEVKEDTLNLLLNITEITKEEIKICKGPVNYITHHKVYWPGSLSTPIHVEFNSSFNNWNTSLNKITIKGPNMLAEIFNNLIKFKSYQLALVFDITKV